MPTASFHKADLTKRFLAALIDGVLASVVGMVPFVGGIVGTAYIVARDGLEFDFMDRRSIGKHVMKLRPVRLDGRPLDLTDSVKRNWMFGLGALTSLLLYVPIIGWLLIPFVAFVALGIALLEVYKVYSDERGRRWGDKAAGTVVVEDPA